LAATVFLGCRVPPTTAGPVRLEAIQLPPGFEIGLYADNVKAARSMTLGSRGTLFVGTREKNGSVYAVLDRDGDNKADGVVTIAEKLDMPNGVAFRNGSLYVAEISRVLRFDDIESRLDNPPRPAVVNDSFPDKAWHGWKFIAFSPDGWLYVPVGAPCNVCLESDERFASIMRMKPDGTGLEVFARGIRNTVGFDWHPQTGEMWFTENGRDWMSDRLPPDELNRAPRQGMHFGFPYVHGSRIRDPEYGGKAPTGLEFAPPEAELDPHCAALGMRFYTGRMFPPEYQGQIFIAEHGSWNRYNLPPSGYRVSLVRLKDGRVADYTFASGWLQDGKAWGRPVDVHVMPDGSMLVSDDLAGVIYRISYRGRTEAVRPDASPQSPATRPGQAGR
jgi:glucose/arabinose dehydrogenase